MKSHPIRPTQPYLNHETLTQDQQAKHLGVKQETVMNLGHPCPNDKLVANPLGPPVDYTSGHVGKLHIEEGENDGIAPRSLKSWAGYASKNSYGSKK